MNSLILPIKLKTSCDLLTVGVADESQKYLDIRAHDGIMARRLDASSTPSAKPKTKKRATIDAHETSVDAVVSSIKTSLSTSTRARHAGTRIKPATNDFDRRVFVHGLPNFQATHKWIVASWEA